MWHKFVCERIDGETICNSITTFFILFSNHNKSFILVICIKPLLQELHLDETLILIGKHQ